MEQVIIRDSTDDDLPAIARIHREAFGGSDEAELALAILKSGGATISLMACSGDTPVGHILLSDVAGTARSLALAPLAVLPEWQNHKFGSRLVWSAIARARELGYKAIFVLGEPGYYERFGFSHKAAASFEVEWQGPYFMAMELRPQALVGESGRLHYHPAFQRLI